MSRVYLRWYLSIIAFILLAAGTGWAGDLETVPVGSRVYTDLELLAGEGLITNYSGSWVRSGNPLSRFEIAYFIKQFINERLNQRRGRQIEPEISPGAIESLQRLIGDFQEELGDLGINITDIHNVSPKLVKADLQTDEYLDLDQLLHKDSFSASNEPFYYLGQYYWELKRKSFIFIPFSYVEPDNIGLLESLEGVNVVYQPSLLSKPSFLVVKGSLPVHEELGLPGYYLFPLDDNSQTGLSIPERLPQTGISNRVLALLDEVNQMQQVQNLWKFSGSLSFEGYRKLETDLQSKLFLGDLRRGLKFGGLLIYTNTPSSRPSLEMGNLGLPFYNPRGAGNAVDLDSIKRSDIKALQINFQGSISLTPQASIYGGVDLLYRDFNYGLADLWPTDTKASAGLQYEFNDYWTVLTYQSFVNSQSKNSLLSTTSVGVEYNRWMTLWLAYQFLKFDDDPTVTGAFSFRF